jgi:hypothetical protein
MREAAIVLLLATIALGAFAGVRFLMRSRLKGWVRAHLVAALAALAVVGAAVMTGPASAVAAWWPVLLLALAIAAGWSSRRVARRTDAGSKALLVGHVFTGVASFFVFLAWAKGL